MNPWTDLAVSLLAIVAGMTIGWRAGRGWVAVYGVGLIVTALIGVVTRWPQASEWQFLGWAGDVRLKSWLAAMVIPALLLAPTHRLATVRRMRILIGSCVLAGGIGVAPLLSAVMVAERLRELPTRWGPDGVCRQQTDFTCGPAAAVTALKRLGVMADEGAMALAAVTTPLTGTSPEAMARMLKRGFGDRGVQVGVRNFEGLEELDPHGVTLVVVRYGFMVDHWVCVLGVTDKGVEVGDPGCGREVWSRSDFEQRWRKVGVELRLRVSWGFDLSQSEACNTQGVCRGELILERGWWYQTTSRFHEYQDPLPSLGVLAGPCSHGALVAGHIANNPRSCASEGCNVRGDAPEVGPLAAGAAGTRLAGLRAHQDQRGQVGAIEPDGRLGCASVSGL